MSKSLYFRYIFSAVVAAAAIIFIWAWSNIYLPFGNDESAQEFKVEQGQGLIEITANLKEAGLIKSKFAFEFHALATGKQGELKAGLYRLNSRMNIPVILDTFVAGQTAQTKVIIIEGWNLRDISGELSRQGIAGSQEFLRICDKDFSGEYDFLRDKPAGQNLEGYIFPDTYLIDNDAKAESLVSKALSNFDEKLTSGLRTKIKEQGKTIFEIINMASLLEREVKIYEDKQLVAGILWKRLKQGWPLQVDAAVAYGLGKSGTKLSKDDLKIDNPYNTYKYRGLPPGPICNPGLDSIKAAVYPKPSLYWFYLSTPDGQTIFSKTLDEHNTAKAKYL